MNAIALEDTKGPQRANYMPQNDPSGWSVSSGRQEVRKRTMPPNDGNPGIANAVRYL